MNEIVQFSDKILTFTNEKQWLVALDQSYNNYKRAGWEFFIVLRDGIKQFGLRDNRKKILLEQAAQQMELGYTTLENYYLVSVSEVAPIAYGLGLSFGHAEAVYGHDISYAEHLLHTAAEWQWNANKLKNEAWRVKHGKEQRSQNSLTYEEPPVIQQNVPNVQPPPAQAARSLIQIVSGVHRDKYLTTLGAPDLPVAMTFEEAYALDVYNHVASDGLNWTRGDRYNRMISDLKTKARRENWPPAKLQSEITRELWQMATHSHCSTETILLNAATAAAFPNERWQTITIGYAHHELLRNSEVAGEWLARAEQNKWTPEQLDEALHPNRNTDDAIINIIRGVQGIQLDESQIILTSGQGKLVITQWRIE